jgi:ribosomal protein L35AE/L33A
MYKTLKISFFFTLFSAFTTLFAWKEYQSYEGRFSIQLPTEDVLQKIIPIKTLVGDLEEHSFYQVPPNSDAENKFYQVTYIDYPAGTFHRDSTELRDLFYQTSLESAALRLGGKVMYSDNTETQSIRGKVWRIDYNRGNSVMKTKVFLFGDRFFTVSVATQKARSRNLEMDKFLDSFSFIAQK